MPNPNFMINQKLLSLKDVDLICIAAVHFSHLMRNRETLSTIRSNNLNTAIYFMPHFPYSKNILERAAELEYPFRSCYLGPLVRGVHNARNFLGAEVRFRHEPAYFRLALWAKLKAALTGDPSGRSGPLNLEQFSPEEIADGVEEGGFFVQQYIHGQEGFESRYINVTGSEWGAALKYFVHWFFYRWGRATSTIMSEVLQNENYQRIIASDLDIRLKQINSLAGQRRLDSHLENIRPLQELYVGIERGDI